MKKHIWLILILILGLYLRLNPDTIQYGSNYDELAMTSIAALKFPFEILKQCAFLDFHAPLYYLTAHFFIGNASETLYLRLFNIALSLFNIFIFYKIGFELKNKNLGLLLAFALAINHEHIASVSFIKFYALCFLLVSISFYYFIKTIENSKFGFKLGIINAIYCFSATLGFFYIISQYIVLFLINKKDKKVLIKSFLVSLCGFLAYLPILIIQSSYALTNIISPHSDYPSAGILSTYYFLNDYFSPLLNFSCSTTTVASGSLLMEWVKYNDIFSLIIFIVFSFIPVAIGIYGIYKSYKTHRTAKAMLGCAIIFFIIFYILTTLRITGFVAVYPYASGFMLLICAILGLYNLENKKLKIFLLTVLFLPQLFISNYYPIEKREHGNDKIFAPIEDYLLKNRNNGKIFIVTTGGRFLAARYKNTFNFDYEQTGAGHGRVLLELIYGKNLIKKANKNNIRNLIKPVILGNIKNKEFDDYIDKNLINNLHKGDEAIYAINCDISPYLLKDNEIKNILTTSNYKIYKSTLEAGLNNTKTTTLSNVQEAINTYSNMRLIENLDKKLKRVKIEQFVSADRKNYKKIFESKDFNRSTLWIAQNAIEGWIFVTYQKE